MSLQICSVRSLIVVEGYIVHCPLVASGTEFVRLLGIAVGTDYGAKIASAGVFKLQLAEGKEIGLFDFVNIW